MNSMVGIGRLRAPRRLSGSLAAALLVGAAGCINMQSDRGVEPGWHATGPEAFVPGETTRREVLALLGPPSQILTLEAGSAFYYMQETTRAKGLILLLYNDRREATRYDRAVFFFDRDEVLTDYAATEASP